MGCQQSTAVQKTSTIQAVGQTERLVSRAERLKSSKSKQSLPPQRQSSGGGAASTASSTSVEIVEPPKLDTQGNLMPEEIVRRTTSSIFSKTTTLGTPQHKIVVEYAHWTQRGYYPDDPNKENQDESNITQPFAGRGADAMFACYDGHGKNGHACARFAKKKLPQFIAKYVRQARVKKYQAVLKQQGSNSKVIFDPEKWPLLSMEEYKQCCRKAFLDCNKAMHDANMVEDKMSGTTAITVNFHGNHITVCNVGDSRAILGHCIPGNGQENNVGSSRNSNGEEEKTEIEPADSADDDIPTKSKSDKSNKDFPKDGEILAIPLSRDQTPYRKDERERVKKQGAAVMSIDQMEGHEEMHENWGDMVLGQDLDVHGDPPRVWVEGKDYPGTAFTRSLGDRLAEDIGVSAEPEMLSRELTSNDHVLVIATDGIFEFLTNQEIINKCLKCDSPLQACQRLVKAAYDKWLIYEQRTDDITIIVCFLSVDQPPPTDGREGTTEDLLVLAKSIYGNKPIRKRPRSVYDNLHTSSDLEDGAASKKAEASA